MSDLGGQRLAVAMFTACQGDTPGRLALDLMADATRDDLEHALMFITGFAIGLAIGQANAQGVDPGVLLADWSRTLGRQVASREADRG